MTDRSTLNLVVVSILIIVINQIVSYSKQQRFNDEVIEMIQNQHSIDTLMIEYFDQNSPKDEQ